MTTLPTQFCSLMNEQWGLAEAASLLEALSGTEPIVSVRLNPAKAPLQSLPLAPVPWCPWGYYLPERPQFTFDPLLHAGVYYVQDASSMYLWHLMKGRFQRPVVALDLCAAPGGKTTLLHTVLPPGSVVLSNDPVRQRAQVLAENVAKWGEAHSIVTQNYPQDFEHMNGLFDLVVADVPCSGEGMFRKDKQAVAEWSMENVEMCQERQREIVKCIWPTLKPGGLMVYGTCTFNHMENEDNVQWICTQLDAEVVEVPTNADWNIVGKHHFLPSRVRGEGQFMTLVRKADETCTPCTPIKTKNKAKAKAQRASALPAEPKHLRQCVEGDFCFHTQADGYRAIPAAMEGLYQVLAARLCILSAGILLATPKGHGWQPAHQLALSTRLRPEAFAQVELSAHQALAYLRHEALSITAPRGYVLLTHRGLPLGFAHNLGSRANNLYPAEWRIRSGYTNPFSLFSEQE